MKREASGLPTRPRAGAADPEPASQFDPSDIALEMGGGFDSPWLRERLPPFAPDGANLTATIPS